MDKEITKVFHSLKELQEEQVIQLQKENKNLQQRIDKAVEYIEIQLSQGGPRETRDLVDGYDLLNILKGDDKNDN